MDRANEIFISYTTSHGGSGRYWSQNIRQHPEGRGVPCFRDAELIRAGDDFEARIRKALTEVKLLIVVIDRWTRAVVLAAADGELRQQSIAQSRLPVARGLGTPQARHRGTGPIDPDLFTLAQAARYSDTSLMLLIKADILAADQVAPYAPLEIRRADLDSEPIGKILAHLKATGKLVLDARVRRLRPARPGTTLERRCW